MPALAGGGSGGGLSLLNGALGWGLGLTIVDAVGDDELESADVHMQRLAENSALVGMTEMGGEVVGTLFRPVANSVRGLFAGSRAEAEAVTAAEKAAAEAAAEGECAASKGVQANKAAGDAWEAEVLNNQLPKTQTQIQPQITIKSGGPSGKRVRLDAVGTDSATGGVKLSDAKASATAPHTPNQKVVYPELEVHGGTVVGKGKPPYVGGTPIPPTKVDIIRKP